MEPGEKGRSGIPNGLSHEGLVLTNQRHPYGETQHVCQLVKQDLLITPFLNCMILSFIILHGNDSDQIQWCDQDTPPTPCLLCNLGRVALL